MNLYLYLFIFVVVVDKSQVYKCFFPVFLFSGNSKCCCFLMFLDLQILIKNPAWCFSPYLFIHLLVIYFTLSTAALFISLITFCLISYWTIWELVQLPVHNDALSNNIFCVSVPERCSQALLHKVYCILSMEMTFTLPWSLC